MAVMIALLAVLLVAVSGGIAASAYAIWLMWKETQQLNKEQPQ